MGPMNYSHNEAADSKQGHEGIGKKMETWQIAFCLWEICWLQCPNSPSGSVGGNIHMTSELITIPPIQLICTNVCLGAFGHLLSLLFHKTSCINGT